MSKALKKRKNFEVKFDHEDRSFNPTKAVVFRLRFSFDLNFCKKNLLVALNHNYWWPKYGAKMICCAHPTDQTGIMAHLSTKLCEVVLDAGLCSFICTLCIAGVQ